MDKGVKFCVDRSCRVHEMFPNSLPGYNELCFMCAGPITHKKPEEPIVVKEQIVPKSHRAIRKHW